MKRPTRLVLFAMLAATLLIPTFGGVVSAQNGSPINNVWDGGLIGDTDFAPKPSLEAFDGVSIPSGIIPEGRLGPNGFDEREPFAVESAYDLCLDPAATMPEIKVADDIDVPYTEPMQRMITTGPWVSASAVGTC